MADSPQAKANRERLPEHLAPTLRRKARPIETKNHPDGRPMALDLRSLERHARG